MRPRSYLLLLRISTAHRTECDGARADGQVSALCRRIWIHHFTLLYSVYTHAIGGWFAYRHHGAPQDVDGSGADLRTGQPDLRLNRPDLVGGNRALYGRFW